jgi:acetylornithine deacetylase/succinyl-diaminopimelate desuccinylase-like protein
MTIAPEVETYIAAHKQKFLEDLISWLRIPSISTLPKHRSDVAKAAEYTVEQLMHIGMERVEVLQTQGHPLVYAEWLKASGKPTLLFYGHYDVQPADPTSLWQTSPFEPLIRNGQIFARGASDDKGQVMLVFKAIEALMQTHKTLPLNIKVLIEGEEEAGSDSVEQYVKAHSEQLGCDAALICDTHVPAKDLPALIYGLRGMIYTEIEVQGARRDLHSGTYGGIAPNPLHAIAIIISRLKDADGHIHIPGLLDKLRQPTDAEKVFWREDPLSIGDSWRKEMGIEQLSGEQEYPPLARATARPTLEVHGIVGGFVDEGAKTVIPATAKAKISLRLPPDLDLKSTEAFTLFERAVKSSAPTDVKVTVRNLHRGEGTLFSPQTPPMKAATAALKEIYGKLPVFLREGGSIPMAALFDEVLHVPVVLMGFGLPDDNLHAPNEKFDLDQFYNGVRTVACFLQKMAE